MNLKKLPVGRFGVWSERNLLLVLSQKKEAKNEESSIGARNRIRI